MDPFRPFTSALALPWETGWGAALVGSSSDQSLPDFVGLRAMETNMVNWRAQAGSANSLADAVKRVAERAVESDGEASYVKVEPATVEEQDGQERHTLLTIIADWLMRGLEEEPVVRDSFAERSTGTLRLRVTSLKLYGRWKGHVLPVTEESVYEYLCHLRDVGAPPTRGKSFVEAVCLLAAVAGAPCLSLVAQSARVRGAAFNLLATKTHRKQKSPLTWNQ
eukprot:6471575-Amphidinium_carterae.1